MNFPEKHRENSYDLKYPGPDTSWASQWYTVAIPRFRIPLHAQVNLNTKAYLTIQRSNIYKKIAVRNVVLKAERT